MTFLCDMIYFITVLLFGSAVSFCFTGITVHRKNLLSLLFFCIFEGLLQIMISHFFGMEFAKQLYPAITHLPLILFWL